VHVGPAAVIINTLGGVHIVVRPELRVCHEKELSDCCTLTLLSTSFIQQDSRSTRILLQDLMVLLSIDPVHSKQLPHYSMNVWAARLLRARVRRAFAAAF